MKNCEKSSALKSIVIILSIIAALVAIGVAIDLLYKKYKLSVEGFNDYSDMDYFDDDNYFCDSLGCDCDDDCTTTPEVCCEFTEEK
ncbi:MAG: hypothetical protein FWB93_02120 [Oscillospiraceae bacterium]|nr:hypothetical protein [Oscillospiraceae bacterium]